TPSSCKYFGYSCIPSSPIGPCMVSSEGACNIEFMCKGDSHECS
ncbi:MAG: hypothetical protein RR515_04515, partial [Clostridium sp.]